jgi:hypothetical protein
MYEQRQEWNFIRDILHTQVSVLAGKQLVEIDHIPQLITVILAQVRPLLSQDVISKHLPHIEMVVEDQLNVLASSNAAGTAQPEADLVMSSQSAAVIEEQGKKGETV